MTEQQNLRPQVSGSSGEPRDNDGSQRVSRARGAKNPRARSIFRQRNQSTTKMDSDTNLNILTYNVRTLMRDERLLELENALKEIKWDVIGLSEVRRTGENTEERENSIFYHFGATRGLYGIGFLVAKKWKNNIIEFLGYSERVAVLKLSITGQHNLTIVQAYAPTSSHSDDELEDFYDVLNKACEENRSTWNVITGDFNAKVGIKQELDNPEVLGPHGLGTRNDRGTALIQFAFGQGFRIMNSFFPKKSQRRWTWISPDGRTKNEIDFVLSCSRNNIVKDVSIINKFKFSSDHRPVRAKIVLNVKLNRKAVFKNRIKKLNKDILITNMDKFNLELKNSFDLLPIDIHQSPETQYSNIIESISTATKKIKCLRRSNNKLSSNTISLIENREKLKDNRVEYNKIDRLVKRSIRKDVRDGNTNMIKSALLSNTTLRNAKQGITKGKTWISNLTDENGVKQSSSSKIIDIATKFYKNLYQAQQKQPRHFTYYCPDAVHPISPYEVQRALREMKYNKSPGMDGITTEVLKLGRSVLVPHLTSFFNTILHTGCIPSEMCHSNIILLHKKGDKADISNYRPISLISHLYKLFIKIIENRIGPTLDFHQPPEQAGFRPHFSTTDHLHTINQVIEKFCEFNKPLYLAFVDYAKAFDSIDHQSVINALEYQNVPHTYIDLIDTIYRNSSAKIKLHISGPNFHIEKGVKQGDPLSPKLFTSALQEVFNKLPDSWHSRGINVNDHQLTNLRFADDIVLFSTSASELQEMLQDLSTASLEVGLSMNRSKTQVMTNSTKRRVEVDGHVLQYVDEYTYLGQIVSFKNRQDKEIERRVQNAWKSFWALKEHMKGSLPITLKRKLIDMCILPVLTYGAQSWSLTEQQKSKLKICQRAMERSIIGVKRTDRVRNTTLRSITQVADVGEKTAKLKWEWAGHVARMRPERWATIVTHWTPVGGNRRRGRPRRRWCDDLISFAGRTWPDIAQDRELWKEKGEAFAQQWDTQTG